MVVFPPFRIEQLPIELVYYRLVKESGWYLYETYGHQQAYVTQTSVLKLECFCLSERSETVTWKDLELICSSVPA